MSTTVAPDAKADRAEASDRAVAENSLGRKLVAPAIVLMLLVTAFPMLRAIWLSFFSDRVRIRKTTRNAGIAGVVSGLCGGLFSVNGPPMVLYFISVIEEKKTYLATLQAYFIINNIYLLIIRSASGLMPEGIGLSALFGLGGLLIGSFIGGKIFNKIDGKKLKKIVYIVMVVSGLWIAIHG